MIKKIILILFISTYLIGNSFAAGSSDEPKTKSDYDKAVSLIKSAKKFEKKGENDKALDRYTKAQKLLIKSNEDKPLQADTLNYLGFSTRKIRLTLKWWKILFVRFRIDPTHIGINEYLGELYVATQRINLANERLEVLKSCNCEEYLELKEIIDGTKTTK